MRTLEDEELIRLIENLPSHLKKEVRDFAEYLLYKKRAKLQFEWEGALAHLKDEYTSVELQKKALEWRTSS